MSPRDVPPTDPCFCEWCQFTTRLFGRRYLSLCTKALKEARREHDRAVAPEPGNR